MRKQFCPKEDEYIISNCDTISYGEIANALGRQYGSVYARIHILKSAKPNNISNKKKPRIKVPIYKGVTNKLVHKLLKLKVGESFRYPINEQSNLTVAKRYIPSRHYRTRWENDTHRLVWREY